MADNLQVSASNANVLYDIEPLIVPGVDWLFWFESLGWLIAGLLIVMVVLYFGSRWYRPLVLKWQLKALSKKVLVTEQGVSKPQVWKLYQWLKQLERSIELSHQEQSALFISDFEALVQQVNQAGFSEQSVSRETYLALIQQAEQLLKQLSVLSDLKTGTAKAQTEGERWKP